MHPKSAAQFDLNDGEIERAHLGLSWFTRAMSDLQLAMFDSVS